MGMTLEEVNGEIEAIERRIGEMWDEVRELREVRRVLEEKSNEDHLSNPRPGDLWHDLFLPVLMVLEVDSERVAVCEENGCTFDPDKVRRIPRAEFKEIIRRHPDGGLIHHCIPGGAEALVRMWAENRNQ
jgi:hypothetical protein